MKKHLAVLALTGIAVSAHATVIANVISSTPVVQTVNVPQQNCRAEQVLVEQPKSGAGATIGAVAGGILGSTVGHGSGKAAATAAGIVTGAVVGNSLERTGNTTVQTVQTCQMVNVTQQQVVGYDVVYEYAGQRYTARLVQAPEATLAIEAPVPVVTTTMVIGPRSLYVAPPVPVVVTPAPAVVLRRAPILLEPARPAFLHSSGPYPASHGGNPPYAYGTAPAGQPHDNHGGQGNPPADGHGQAPSTPPTQASPGPTEQPGSSPQGQPPQH